MLHPQPTLVQVTTHESWTPGALCTTYRQLDRLHSLLSSMFYAYTILERERPFASSKFSGLSKMCELIASCISMNLSLELSQS